MRCPNCGGYSFDADDGCPDCGHKRPKPKPPAWWGSRDFSDHSRQSAEGIELSEEDRATKELGERLHQRREETRRRFETLMTGMGYPPSEEESDIEMGRRKLHQVFERTELLVCPKCGTESLFWNRYFVYYECSNQSCRKTFPKDEIEQKCQKVEG